jgi:hypothetical protein
MTKQQHQQSTTPLPLPHEEPISAELLLRGHTLTERIIDQLRKKNDETGIEMDAVDYWARSNQDSMAKKRVKASDIFIQYESWTKSRKLRWLRQVQNQRSGAFYSLKNLIDNGVIDDSERQLFDLPDGIDDYPYRQIYQFHRIKRGDGSEYFSTHEQWVGISKSATVVTLPVSDLYWYIRPSVKYELRNAEGGVLQPGHSVVDNKTFQIATIRTGPDREPFGTKTYTHKFTPELAYSALKLAHGTVGDVYNGSSMMLVSDSARNPVNVKDPKLWAEAPFDQLFEEVSRPQPQINVSGKDLLNYVKHDRESKEQAHQYG